MPPLRTATFRGSSGRRSRNTSTGTKRRDDTATALAATNPVVRLERRPGHARHTANHLAEGDPVSKILIGRYEATIYPEGYGFTGAISLGFDGKGNRQRIKRKGRTKAIVKDKLIKAVADREAGLKTVEGYTVARRGPGLAGQGAQGPRRGHDHGQPHPGRAACHPADRGDQAQGTDRRRGRRVARRAHGQARDPEPARRPRDPQAGHPAGPGPRPGAAQRG